MLIKLTSKTILTLLCLLAFVSRIDMVSAQTELTANPECVILLHGLARTSNSMKLMKEELESAGFVVANIDYPSREKTVQQLATPTIDQGLQSCEKRGASAVHVVTHSMGGILFRQYVSEHGADKFSRTVMLAPPNQGSEVVDELGDLPGFKFLNGPAGVQLGTDANSLPLKLGPAVSDVAVIAGTFSINIYLSTHLPDPDDGKVSVERTRLDGMCAHLQVDVSHPYIMKDEKVIEEVQSYLTTGKFSDATAEHLDCAFKNNG